MTITPANFKDISKQYYAELGDWRALIPQDVPCVLGTYNQGEPIASRVDLAKYKKDDSITSEVKEHDLIFHDINFEQSLGIVLKGRAEIYEKHIINDFTAYRPIRILKKGELFGDFSVVDKCLDVSGNSRPGETWEISAGFKSVLITNKVTDKTLKKYFKHSQLRTQKTSLIEPHRFLDKLFTSITIIVFIDSSFVQEHKLFFNKLLAYSWCRAKIYRDALNSYNYSNKLRFATKVNTLIYDLFSKEENKSIKSYLPLFIDAVYDVYNRPIREEPMFVVTPSPGPEAEPLIQEAVLTREQLLCADDYSAVTDYWFPLDYGNYLVSANCCKDRDLEKTVSKNLKIRTFRDRYIKIANAMFTDHETFKDLFLTDIDKYPFLVNCFETDGGLLEGRGHIVLHFKRKTPVTTP